MITIGVDPGKAGAIVVCDGPRVVEVVRLADIVGRNDWRDVAGQLADRCRSLVVEHRPAVVVVERDAGRPGEGAGSARTIGRGWGIVFGIFAGLGVQILTPTAATWTRAMHRDIPGADPKARSIAIATAAGVELTRGREVKPQDGIADAYCLARYGQTHPLAGA